MSEREEVYMSDGKAPEIIERLIAAGIKFFTISPVSTGSSRARASDVSLLTVMQ